MQIRAFNISSQSLFNEKVPVKHPIQHITQTYSKNANMAKGEIYCLFVYQKNEQFYIGYRMAIQHGINWYFYIKTKNTSTILEF